MICPKHQKYLQSFVVLEIYQYTCTSNCHVPAMRMFMRFVLHTCANRRFVSEIFADDSYVQESTYKSCFENIKNTIELLQNLEFTLCKKNQLREKTFLYFAVINRE